MTLSPGPHRVLGTGTHTALITLWTKKEHVLTHINPAHYAIASQLYSRDEGINQLLRGLLENPSINHVVMTGTDMNDCAKTLQALWKNGVADGRVVGADGYVDKELPVKAINSVRTHVTLHDKRDTKNYAELDEYLATLPKQTPYAEPRTYPAATITPPSTFPNTHNISLRHDTIMQATIELAHLLARFGTLYNVQTHLATPGNLRGPYDAQTQEYTENVLGTTPGTYGAHIHQEERLTRLTQDVKQRGSGTITFSNDEEAPALALLQAYKTDDQLHLVAHMDNTTLGEYPLLANSLFTLLTQLAKETKTERGNVTINATIINPAPEHLVQELAEQPHVLRRTGDPRSNLLINIAGGRIHVTHLSPDGQRLETFSAEHAREAYKRLIVEHRLTDLSHAAYIGYELARAEQALKTGEAYEQDA